jgi:pimeloyl-ACP methyl ester carboxylesterase
MAGLHTRLFTLRHPGEVKGLVLVDATSPNLAGSPWGRSFLKSYKPFGRVVDWLSALRIMPLATPWFGDITGVDPEAHRELNWFYAQRSHEHWGARETEQSYEAGQETLAAGQLDPAMPVVAIFRANDAGANSPWGRLRVDAATASRRGAVVSVDRASHPSLIGRDHAEVVVKAVLSVMDSAAPSTRDRS